MDRKPNKDNDVDSLEDPPILSETDQEMAIEDLTAEQLEAERVFDSEANWFSGRQVYRRKPKQANQIINQLMAKKGFNQSESLQQIQDIWESLLDEPLRNSTRATGIRAGKQMVVVKNAVINQELAFKKSELLQQLKNSPIGNRIKDIRFQIGVF